MSEPNPWRLVLAGNRLLVLGAFVIVGAACTDDYGAGMAAYKRGDFKTARTLFLRVAEQGHTNAQFNLGKMYQNSQGVPQDYELAMNWFRKAAEQDFAPAQHNIGVPRMSNKKKRAFSRRDALIALKCTTISAVTFGAVGVAAGYKFRHQLHDIWRTTFAGGSLDTPGVNAFAAEREEILKRRRLQTAEGAETLKVKYARPMIGEVSVWSLISRLEHCTDYTDLQLFAVSQFVHVKQVLAAMKREEMHDPYLALIALLHDAGKVALLYDVPPEHILGGERRLSSGELRGGLEKITFEYGHAELIYSRIRDYVPEPVAWAVRYHNIDIEDALPFMTEKEIQYTERYLRPFRRFDTGFKSYTYAPKIDVAPYQKLIQEYFPKPILF